ncbi:hypothetical protein OUZ56_015803 [Daphnia magna]|uniref:Uncharacterized protein n=1 Tax=Daphnia magna TaxID=35525 RepID=A0ABR0ANW0_9CRUS|nr:hypothetical protein OUZ56_015803 [Daphnia magna]
MRSDYVRIFEVKVELSAAVLSPCFGLLVAGKRTGRLPTHYHATPTGDAKSPIFQHDEGGSDSMMNRPLFGMRNNTRLVHETLSRFPFFFLAQICDAPLKEEEIPSRLAAIHWQKHRNSM